MGTSGAFGGSGTNDWQDVRSLWADLGDAPASPGAGNVSSGEGGDYDSLGSALARALLGRSNSSAVAPTLGAVLPQRRSSGRNTVSSRSGGGQAGTRNFSRQAARGGAAIGAAYAYRDRDVNSLREFGLNLADLDAMSPRNRCSAILDQIGRAHV